MEENSVITSEGQVKETHPLHETTRANDTLLGHASVLEADYESPQELLLFVHNREVLIVDLGNSSLPKLLQALFNGLEDFTVNLR